MGTDMADPLSPRAVLDALRLGHPLPALPEDAVARARALALSPSDAPAAHVEALPEPLALAVLEAAVLARAPALVDALAHGANKPLAKAAKKAAYKLRSAGVALPEPAPAPVAPPPRRPAAPAEELPCLSSPLGGDGTRTLLVVRPLPGGSGVELIEAVLQDERGVVELALSESGRSPARRFIRALEADPGAAAVKLTRAEAVALLAEAAGQNEASHTPFPPGLDVALRHLGAAPARAPLEVPPPEPDDARLAAQADRLHLTREVGAWLPPEGELERLAQRLDEVQTSRLVLSDAQRGEELRGMVHALAHAFFTPPVRALYARRLWHMGTYFERAGRPEDAALARAEARTLAHTSAPSRFAETLFEKALALMGRALAEQQRRAAPAPAGAGPEERAGPEAPGERRSPGGLILP